MATVAAVAVVISLSRMEPPLLIPIPPKGCFWVGVMGCLRG